MVDLKPGCCQQTEECLKMSKAQVGQWVELASSRSSDHTWQKTFVSRVDLFRLFKIGICRQLQTAAKRTQNSKSSEFEAFMVCEPLSVRKYELCSAQRVDAGTVDSNLASDRFYEQNTCNDPHRNLCLQPVRKTDSTSWKASHLDYCVGHLTTIQPLPPEKSKKIKYQDHQFVVLDSQRKLQTFVPAGTSWCMDLSGSGYLKGVGGWR